MSIFQSRYLKHQLKKKEVLMKLIKQRHSTRIFDDREVEAEKVAVLLKQLEYAPTSCNRQGIYTLNYTDRNNKALLGGLLVGGVGWIHRAPLVILLFADPNAYLEGTEIMPYLDAGVQIAYLYLVAHSLGLKACYVNPNIRLNHIDYFKDSFGSDIFCGAMALGYEKK